MTCVQQHTLEKEINYLEGLISRPSFPTSGKTKITVLINSKKRQLHSLKLEGTTDNWHRYRVDGNLIHPR